VVFRAIYPAKKLKKMTLSDSRKIIKPKRLVPWTSWVCSSVWCNGSELIELSMFDPNEIKKG
jgi:hypothetical protein